MVEMCKYAGNDYNIMGMIFLYGLWSDPDENSQEVFQKCLEQWKHHSMIPPLMTIMKDTSYFRVCILLKLLFF